MRLYNGVAHDDARMAGLSAWIPLTSLQNQIW